MQDFEAKRWEAAKALFEEAFRRGYTNTKAQLAAQPHLQVGDAPERWTIEVPRDDIADGLGPSHAPRFEQAGEDAALAQRRGDSESDCQLVDGPDSHHAFMTNDVRWMVWLEAQDIALPKRP